MRRSAWRRAWLGLAAAALFVPRGWTYSGVGLSAVGRAVGQVPGTVDELQSRIEVLEAARRNGDVSARTSYALAVLQLNRPKSWTLAGPRAILADAVVADPGYLDTLELWLDLVPAEDELNAVLSRLATPPASGPEAAGGRAAAAPAGIPVPAPTAAADAEARSSATESSRTLAESLAGALTAPATEPLTPTAAASSEVVGPPAPPDPRAARDWARARVQHQLGRYPEAERSLLSAVAADSRFRGRAAWLRSVMAGEQKDDDAATRRFLEALDFVDHDTEDLLWRTAIWVAAPDEIEAHKNAFTADPREFFLSFWKRRDVFPLTDINERLGEHLRRLKRARELYALASNGFGYFNSHDEFKNQSPDLPFHSSDVVYDYQARIPTWIDHRGLVYVRHGDPDRSARASETVRAETWLYTRWSFKPLLFHFVDRRSIGEFAVTLNLAQANATSGVEDDPEIIIDNATDFRDLYGTRAGFHGLFQRVSMSRSRTEIEDLLIQEAQMMAAFLREAWYDDTNNLLKKDDILPFSAYSANFRDDDASVAAYVYYAVPEKELKLPGPVFEFDATLVLFSSNWSEKLASADHHFRYERPAGRRAGKKDLLVGGLELRKLPPGRYNFAFQVTERKTGKIGIARGRFVADYFGPGWVNLSEPLLAERIEPSERSSVFERHGQRVVPIPTRTLSRDRPAEVYLEIYDLAPGEDGKLHYRVEHRLLQIQQEPSVLEKVLGYGMDIAGLFFPYEIFLARAGMFGLSVASSGPGGLDVNVEERTANVEGPVVIETFRIETKKYPPGIYQAYVTVKDYVSGSINTRSVRFAVTN